MAMSRFLGVACAAWAVLGSDPTPDNMNGDYILSETPNAHDTQKLFPTHFKDYPRPVESFELYSPPIVSLYSQVFWKGLDPVDLPEEIVKSTTAKAWRWLGSRWTRFGARRTAMFRCPSQSRTITTLSRR